MVNNDKKGSRIIMTNDRIWKSVHTIMKVWKVMIYSDRWWKNYVCKISVSKITEWLCSLTVHTLSFLWMCPAICFYLWYICFCVFANSCVYLSVHACLYMYTYVCIPMFIHVDTFSYIFIKTILIFKRKRIRKHTNPGITRTSPAHVDHIQSSSNIFTSAATLHEPACTKFHQTSHCNIYVASSDRPGQHLYMTVIPRAMILSLSRHYRKFQTRYLCRTLALASYESLASKSVENFVVLFFYFLKDILVC